MYSYPSPPHDNEYLFDLNISIDRDWCLQVYKRAFENAETYTDNVHQPFDNWKISRLKSFDYADDIMEELNLIDFVSDYRSRFYLLEKNAVLGTHVDVGTQCSLNFILCDKPAPVTFEDTENFYYQNCLFNTSIPHSVINGNEDRVLFKISIFDKTFDEVRYRIKQRNLSNLSRLETGPLYQKLRDMVDNIPRIPKERYKGLHTSNLIPTNICIDCDLFEKEIIKYADDFQQWGITHTNLKRYGLAITKDDKTYSAEIYPTNWPLDVWNLNNPDVPIIETDFKYPNDVMLSMESLKPILQLDPHLARSNILRRGSNAMFYPHIDVRIPAGNLRLWGTNDPDNNHFCFWDEERQQYIEEKNVERGRLYLADTSKYHHAYSTGEDVYTFFIALQVSAYDKIKQSIQPTKDRG